MPRATEIHVDAYLRTGAGLAQRVFTRVVAVSLITSLPACAVLASDTGVTMMQIPAGAFTMGVDARDAGSQERPSHRVSVDSFMIDRTEVTVGGYRRCVEARVCGKITSGDPLLTDAQWFATFEDDEPIREVSWFDAGAYCKWAGKRLPTEAEWEKAARGPRDYVNPWGNRRFQKGDADIGGTEYVRVGSFPRDVSGYGVADTAGSVMEWVADWYDAEYYNHSPASNPMGPASGSEKVVRGGSWQTGIKGESQRSYVATTRYGVPPAVVNDVIGFRCAKSLGDSGHGAGGATR